MTRLSDSLDMYNVKNDFKLSGLVDWQLSVTGKLGAEDCRKEDKKVVFDLRSLP